MLLAYFLWCGLRCPPCIILCPDFLYFIVANASILFTRLFYKFYALYVEYFMPIFFIIVSDAYILYMRQSYKFYALCIDYFMPSA